jgi:hypothetical protein
MKSEYWRVTTTPGEGGHIVTTYSSTCIDPDIQPVLKPERRYTLLGETGGLAALTHSTFSVALLMLLLKISEMADPRFMSTWELICVSALMTTAVFIIMFSAARIDMKNSQNKT